ncbi:spermidine synthase-like protein [Candidatus Vecturithrix granuli]|uniref:Spermidine synthase-like protein n=1 Tax=Vecturithrix granuli TaxID=1499967 RepID=A0A081C332_VECG1|nr:spermidine synthase-like protein [Candidatus Vecturithrix granuli]
MLFSIFFISMAILAYEICLMRIFAITQWHHFAYMIISIALLGFGASGTVISLCRSRFKNHFFFYYRGFSGLFPLTILLSYVLSQQIRFNPFEIVWNPRQIYAIVAYYLVLFVPFFLAAMCLGLVFIRYPEHIGWFYGANLLGSGCGVLVVVGCLMLWHPVLVLYNIIAVAMIGMSMGWIGFPGKRSMALPSMSMLLIWLGIFSLLWISLKTDPLRLRQTMRISEYKGLSMAQHFPDARILTESVSPLGVVHTVSSPIIRHAPGISLNYAGEIPSQIGLFVDSEQAGAISSAKHLEYLDFLTSTLVYHVRPAVSALILGAGGGTDVFNALNHGMKTIDAVELNPDIIDLVQHRFAAWTAGLYSRPEVRIINQEARGFVEAASSRYDTIHISLLDAFGSSAAGVYALHENYLYTVEAMQRYYSCLTPDGILSITRWVKFPPRDSIKLFATAIEALETLHVPHPSKHIVSIRSWATNTLLVSASPFTPEEISIIRTFCQERSFDPNYFHGMKDYEANRYNQLPSPEHFRAMQAILFGDREKFYASYPYYVRPARDHRPYFFNFFTWKHFSTFLETMENGLIPFIEWGYLVLIGTLLQAIIVSLFLILLPLFVLRKKKQTCRFRVAIILYFTCLGLGYLFIEMVCIQQFSLFLAHPTSAASVVIASFLMFSGCGSLFWAAIIEKRKQTYSVHAEETLSHFESHKRLFLLAIIGIVICLILYISGLSNVFGECSRWNYTFKVFLIVILIAPLAFCLGIPFPLGLRSLRQQADELVPWAYGINGYASVLSSLIATCLAVSFGFQIVMLLALFLYLLAAGIFYEIMD